MSLLRLMVAFAALAGLPGVAHATVFYEENFDSGSPAFRTSYAYAAPTSSTALWSEGRYTVANNPNSVHPLWSSFKNGMGNALIVNGATNGTPSLVFGESGSITAPHAGLYKFTADVADICCNASFSPNANNPFDLNVYFTVNGTQSSTPAANFTSAASTSGIYPGAGTFIPLTTEIYLSAGDTLSFDITDSSSAESGNDFALDNISITSVASAVPEASTWAMMLGGFFGLSLAHYRLAKKSRPIGVIA